MIGLVGCLALAAEPPIWKQRLNEKWRHVYRLALDSRPPYAATMRAAKGRHVNDLCLDQLKWAGRSCDTFVARSKLRMAESVFPRAA